MCIANRWLNTMVKELNNIVDQLKIDSTSRLNKYHGKAISGLFNIIIKSLDIFIEQLVVD